jgi:signal transduction histidine kinase
MASERAAGRGWRAASIFRRIDVRLTVWFSTIFLLSALLLFGFTFVNLYQTLRDQDRTALQGRALGYVARFRMSATERAAITLLLNELSNDILSPTGRPFFARIVTAENAQIFLGIPLRDWQDFDLSELTVGDDPHAEGFLMVSDDRFEYSLEVLGVRLSANYVLQIGSDTQNRMRVLHLFQRSFLLTFSIMLGVSLAGGLFFASRLLRPIGALNETVRSIIETGELDRRIPSRQSNDDLDDMIGSVNAMLDRIQTLVTGLRDSLDAVAHDLRTPLTRLRNTAERALSEQADRETSLEALSDAMEESDRILGMLNAMMDISEAESGAMRLKRRPVDLGDLAREVAEVYSLLADEADMRIVVAIDEDLPISGDPARLRQVIGNLYDNAVKYGEPGTEITVTGRRTPGAESTVELSVMNRGLPIAPGDLDRIWNRLYRGKKAGDRRDGLGLGLALVRAIVQAHGGGVAAESSANGETRFRISL